MNKAIANITSSASSAYQVTTPASTSTSAIEVPSFTPKKLRMGDLTSVVVARSLIQFCRDHGDLMTNLRLQRMLYYVQAWYLALRNAPLFPEEFIASPSGPIEPVVFKLFSEFNGKPIDCAPNNVVVPVTLTKHISDVMEAYGSLSAFDLERLSKDEEPWKAARSSGIENAVISKTLMQQYYKLKLLNGQE